MSADNKSSLVQIAQAVLDEATQSIKVAIAVDGAPVDETNPLPVVIDSQTITVDVALDKSNDSVAAWQGGTWNITNITGTVSLPTGASTEAKQDSQITELQSIKGHVDGVETKLDTLISQTDGIESTLSSINTNIATSANQTSQISELQAIKGYVDGIETKLDTLISQTDGVETSLSSIDTKVATSSNQTNGTQRTKITDGTNNAELAASAPAGTEQALIVRNIPSGTQNVSVTTALPAGTNNIGDVDVLSVPAPLNIVGSGVGTSALRVQLADESLSALENISVTVTNTSLEITNDDGNPIPVSGTVSVLNGVTYRNRVRLVYSTTNVTTGAWVQLLASVGATAIKEIEIFDSSGETLELGVGAVGSEVSNSYIFPGGNGRIPMQIAALSRLSVKAVSATANSGELVINLYG